MNKCDYCGTEVTPGVETPDKKGKLKIVGGDGKLYPNKSWSACGDTTYLGNDSWYHHDCQKEHWSNVVTGLTHLDQPLNDCKFFVRDGHELHGWYERDGKRYPQRLWAGLVTAHLESKKPGYGYFTDCSGFVEWLRENGWWPNWWEGRRPEVYVEDVLKRRKNH